jgi:hypothetical protein
MQFTITMELLHCPYAKCGIQFAVPEEWIKRRREDHQDLYCPNGHVQSFLAESRVDQALRLKKESELRLQAEVNEANHARLVAERALTKVVKEKARIETRMKRGVCACCNRTFSNLASHMETKHKDFALPPAKPKRIAAKDKSKEEPTQHDHLGEI